MLNPARAAYALVGVYDPAISALVADVMRRTGVSKALVVHSMGLDELTPLGDADVVEVRYALGCTVEPNLESCTQHETGELTPFSVADVVEEPAWGSKWSRVWASGGLSGACTAWGWTS